MKHAARSPVSFIAHVARLPQKGLPIKSAASTAEREALAEEHGLLSVESYRADLLVTAWKRHGVKVEGTVAADITQACVVTLEPVSSHIEEEVSAVFLPEDSKLGRLGFHGGGEIILDADGPDSPETFSGDSIDVGAVAEEFFALAIDPYPRKADATLPQTADPDTDDAPGNPLREKLRLLKRDG